MYLCVGVEIIAEATVNLLHKPVNVLHPARCDCLCSLTVSMPYNMWTRITCFVMILHTLLTPILVQVSDLRTDFIYRIIFFVRFFYFMVHVEFIVHCVFSICRSDNPFKGIIPPVKFDADTDITQAAAVRRDSQVSDSTLPDSDHTDRPLSSSLQSSGLQSDNDSDESITETGE